MSAIWSCKVGEADRAKLPHGADLPMRQAVAEAFHEITGEWPEFIFSGWVAELTPGEQSVVDDERTKRGRREK